MKTVPSTATVSPRERMQLLLKQKRERLNSTKEVVATKKQSSISQKSTKSTRPLTKSTRPLTKSTRPLTKSTRPLTKSTSSKVSRVKSKLTSDIAETEAILKTETFTESQHMGAYADIFYKLREIIALQEERCLSTDKTTNIYALMQLYSQLRDTIHDIRAVSDFNELSNRLVQDIIKPMLADIGQNVVDIVYALRKEARELMNTQDYNKFSNIMNNYMLQHGSFLKQSYGRATHQISQAFKVSTRK
jgi:hypothetical protein